MKQKEKAAIEFAEERLETANRPETSMQVLEQAVAAHELEQAFLAGVEWAKKEANECLNQTREFFQTPESDDCDFADEVENRLLYLGDDEVKEE